MLLRTLLSGTSLCLAQRDEVERDAAGLELLNSKVYRGRTDKNRPVQLTEIDPGGTPWGWFG